MYDKKYFSRFFQPFVEVKNVESVEQTTTKYDREEVNIITDNY